MIGMFISPGVTVQSRGLAQADLLDVRTGTILFSVVQPMSVSSKQLMIGAGRSKRCAAGKGCMVGTDCTSGTCKGNNTCM